MTFMNKAATPHFFFQFTAYKQKGFCDNPAKAFI